MSTERSSRPGSGGVASGGVASGGVGSDGVASGGVASGGVGSGGAGSGGVASGGVGSRSADQVRWDSSDYANNSQAQRGWGRELVEKLGLRGSESVLDIGCGEGRLTAELAARVPAGEVVGVDSSTEMIRAARREFPRERCPNLSFEIMDARSLSFHDRFDVAFSNAALHWVKEASAVLRGVARGLKPGGRLLFQMGGRGNAAQVVAVAQDVMAQQPWKGSFEGFDFPWGFWAPEEYRLWCEQEGLSVRRIELISRDMKVPGVAGLAAWLRTTWMPYTARLPEGQRGPFIDRIVGAYAQAHPANERGELVVPMVRLEVEALRAPSASGSV